MWLGFSIPEMRQEKAKSTESLEKVCVQIHLRNRRLEVIPWIPLLGDFPEHLHELSRGFTGGGVRHAPNLLGHRNFIYLIM